MTGSRRRAAVFFIAAIIFAGISCKEEFSRDDPILQKPAAELSDAEISRMVVVMKTNYGSFKIGLHPEWAPKGCRQFLKLVKNAYYYGLTFHEVEPGAMIIGGDPLGDGTGGPGFYLDLETPSGPNVRGAVGIYHPELRPDLNGSMFYILARDIRGMNNKYIVFGEIIEGIATVDRIAGLPVTPLDGKPRPFMPLSEVIIEDVFLEARKVKEGR